MVARNGLRNGLPIVSDGAAPAEFNPPVNDGKAVVPGVRLANCGRAITLAAANRISRSRAGSHTMLVDGSQS